MNPFDYTCQIPFPTGPDLHSEDLAYKEFAQYTDV
jgi:hypothetical protein